MSRRWTTWLALGLWVLSLALGAATIVLSSLADPVGTQTFSTTGLMGQLVFIQSWSSVGALIAAHQPRNPIGWILCTAPLFWWTASAADAWSYVAVERGLGDPALVLALTAPAWFVGTALVAVFGFLLFPDGELLSRRWRPVSGVAAVLLVVTAVTMMLEPGDLQGPNGLRNPIGVEGADAVGGVAFGSMFVLLLASIVSLVLRYRRAAGLDRQQIRVVAVAVCAVAVVLAVTGGINLATSRAAESSWVFTLVVFACFCAIPVSIGIAILRYRLYDVDRVISKTLVYGSLTVILGAAYVGLVLVGQALFSSVAGGGDLAIAVSTLVVAALFLPVRSRVRRLVDRRFYRRRYDAQRTLEAFGARLREEVDLDVLAGDLRGVVTETMQPAHVSVWLRNGPVTGLSYKGR